MRLPTTGSPGPTERSTALPGKAVTATPNRRAGRLQHQHRPARTRSEETTAPHDRGGGSVSASGRRDESRRRAIRVVPVTTRPIATTFAAWYICEGLELARPRNAHRSKPSPESIKRKPPIGPRPPQLQGDAANSCSVPGFSRSSAVMARTLTQARSAAVQARARPSKRRAHAAQPVHEGPRRRHARHLMDLCRRSGQGARIGVVRMPNSCLSTERAAR
jgi:hypothetical protein